MTVSAAPPPGVSLQTEIDALSALQYRNPRQGLQRGLQLRREALRQGEEALAAWACQHASVCAARLQRYGLAERLNREATERFTVHGDQPGLLSAENLRGILAQERAQFREAYGHFHHVLLGSREAGLSEMYGKALNNLTLAAQGMGDLDAALDWSLQGLTFAKGQGNWETYTLTLINHANLYIEVGALTRPGRRPRKACARRRWGCTYVIRRSRRRLIRRGCNSWNGRRRSAARGGRKPRAEAPQPFLALMRRRFGFAHDEPEGAHTPGRTVSASQPPGTVPAPR